MLCCGEMYAIWRVRIEKHSDHKLKYTTLFLALFSTYFDPFILSKRTRWFHLSEIEAYLRSRLCVVLLQTSIPLGDPIEPAYFAYPMRAFAMISFVIFLLLYFKDDFYGSTT